MLGVCCAARGLIFTLQVRSGGLTLHYHYNYAAGNSSFQRKGRYDRSPDSYDEVDHKAIEVRPEDYDFRFENLVFEGGGMKGLAYCGAVRVSTAHVTSVGLLRSGYSLLCVLETMSLCSDSFVCWRQLL